MDQEDIRQQDINVSVTFKVSLREDNKATVQIPPEIRITDALLAFLHSNLAQRGLELAHLDISEIHRGDLASLSSSVIEQSPEAES